MSNNYVKPIIDESLDIEILNGKHPVIEYQLPINEPFIPNSVFLSPKSQQIIMITGPNMSGKSAILRQTAIICLLAQIGCFVPAEKLRMGIIDKIFTRVGASDNISMGESTFMVEMNETALILNNISETYPLIIFPKKKPIKTGMDTINEGIIVLISIRFKNINEKNCIKL